MLDRHLTRQETSAYLAERGLPVAPQTLAAWAVRGSGPAFHHFGRKPLYPVAEIERWAIEQLGPISNSTTAHDALREHGA